MPPLSRGDDLPERRAGQRGWHSGLDHGVLRHSSPRGRFIGAAAASRAPTRSVLPSLPPDGSSPRVSPAETSRPSCCSEIRSIRRRPWTSACRLRATARSRCRRRCAKWCRPTGRLTLYMPQVLREAEIAEGLPPGTLANVVFRDRRSGSSPGRRSSPSTSFTGSGTAATSGAPEAARSGRPGESADRRGAGRGRGHCGPDAPDPRGRTGGTRPAKPAARSQRAVGLRHDCGDAGRPRRTRRPRRPRGLTRRCRQGARAGRSRARQGARASGRGGGQGRRPARPRRTAPRPRCVRGVVQGRPRRGCQHF